MRSKEVYLGLWHPDSCFPLSVEFFVCLLGDGAVEQFVASKCPASALRGSVDIRGLKRHDRDYLKFCAEREERDRMNNTLTLKMSKQKNSSEMIAVNYYTGRNEDF